jgi:hypothetical protein
MHDATITGVDPGALRATPRDLLVDVLGRDALTGSACLEYWLRHATVDLTRSRALEIDTDERGGLSLWLALQGCDVTCATPDGVSERAHALHRRYGIAHRIRYASLEPAELRVCDAFDVIACRSVFTGLAGGMAERRQAIARLYAALTPGGNLLFAEHIAATRRRLARGTAADKDKSCGNDNGNGHGNGHDGGHDSGRNPTIREMKALLEPFASVRCITAGFLGTRGATDRQRRVSGAVDAFLCRWVVPSRWQDVLIGVARK